MDDRIKVYHAFLQVFHDIAPDSAKVKEFESYLEGFQSSEINVPVPNIDTDIWNSERIKDYLDKMDRTFFDKNYGYTITLAYTCLEGIFKAFLKENIPDKSDLNDLTQMAKEVRDYIKEKLTSENDNYPIPMIILISTITNAVANARNSFSDSHFDKQAEASLAQLCRDCVNSISRYVLLFMTR